MKIKSGIYKITNIANGKIYIGSSVNILNRKNTHFSLLRKNKHYNKHLQNSWNKHGERNFKFEILEYVSFKNRKELFEVEQKWIYETKCYNNEIGFNIEKVVKDRDRYGFKISEETREKLRNKIITDQTRINMSNAHLKKPIIQFNFNGELIKKWDSARECARELNILQCCIYECLVKDRRTYKNFIWIYKDEYDSCGLNLKDYINRHKQEKKVVQCDINGNKIKTWKSAQIIAKELNIDSSSIIKCCRHKNKHSKGFVFVYEYEYAEYGCSVHFSKIKEREKNNKILKPVIQYDLDGNEINRFDSVALAKKETGINSISSCIRGVTKTAGGFIWKSPT